MDINKLYYFFAAAESDSFTRAAEHCHIAQTTMSKYIAQLEEETVYPVSPFQERTDTHGGRKAVL